MQNKTINKKNPMNSGRRNYNLYKEKLRKVGKKKAYYLLISFLLILCVFQTIRGVYLNTTKYIVLNQQLNKLEKLNKEATERNHDLKKQIESYTSTKGIEALARDNLKMVGKDEVLVVVKQTPSAENKNNKQKKKTAL